jgi:hypothetical protein
MKQTVQSIQVNICAIAFLSKWFKTWSCFNAMTFNFALEYVILKVKESQVGMGLNGTHQLLVYTDDVNLLGDNRHYKENSEN